jgi:hypothetical protein
MQTNILNACGPCLDKHSDRPIDRLLKGVARQDLCGWTMLRITTRMSQRTGYARPTLPFDVKPTQESEIDRKTPEHALSKGGVTQHSGLELDRHLPRPL